MPYFRYKSDSGQSNIKYPKKLCILALGLKDYHTILDKKI
jgi:hypothetical protein